jgi:hypothetical protein
MTPSHVALIDMESALMRKRDRPLRHRFGEVMITSTVAAVRSDQTVLKHVLS